MTSETDEGRVEDFSTHALFAELQRRLEARRTQAEGAAEGRDLSLAITHLEDAWTRSNSAAYRAKGVWNRKDPGEPL